MLVLFCSLWCTMWHITFGKNETFLMHKPTITFDSIPPQCSYHSSFICFSSLFSIVITISPLVHVVHVTALTYTYIYFLPPAAVSCARSGSSRSWTCPTILSLSTCLPVSRQRSMCVSSWSTQLEATLWCTSTPMFSQSPELCKCSYMLILMSWFVFYNLLTSCPGTRDTDSHQLFLTELYAWLNLIQFYYKCNLI